MGRERDDVGNVYIALRDHPRPIWIGASFDCTSRRDALGRAICPGRQPRLISKQDPARAMLFRPAN